MCGIAGILGTVDDRNRAALKRMSEAMLHRGPDGSGSWESSPGGDGRGALLAFRRLAILDLSPTGEQPMIDPRSGRVLIVNGEIYNYQELRRRLMDAGETFRSSGDAAVLLRCLSLQGHDAVVIVTDHAAVDYDFVAANSPLVIDTRGIYRDSLPNVVKA